MKPEPSDLLVLFDIDGTLLRKAGPHHRQVLEDAAYHVTGIRATTDGVPVAGMLDRDILRVMLRSEGARAADIVRWMPEIVVKAQSLYVRRCPDLSRRVCPGVRQTLRRLLQRGAVTGLVTGNLSRIAWTKMRCAGLDSYFRFGAFAEEGKTRGELARRAIRHARREGWITKNARIVLVGDHPNDVLAARHAGAVSVAVATGVIPIETLMEMQPDFAVPDLRSLSLEQLLCRE